MPSASASQQEAPMTRHGYRSWQLATIKNLAKADVAMPKGHDDRAGLHCGTACCAADQQAMPGFLQPQNVLTNRCSRHQAAAGHPKKVHLLRPSLLTSRAPRVSCCCCSMLKRPQQLIWGITNTCQAQICTPSRHFEGGSNKSLRDRDLEGDRVVTTLSLDTNTSQAQSQLTC